MNKTKIEIQTAFDLYWAGLCNMAPEVVKDNDIKVLVLNAYLNGATDRQKSIEKELGL